MVLSLTKITFAVTVAFLFHVYLINLYSLSNPVNNSQKFNKDKVTVNLLLRRPEASQTQNNYLIDRENVKNNNIKTPKGVVQPVHIKKGKVKKTKENRIKEAIEERSAALNLKNKNPIKRTDKKKQSPGQRSQIKKLNQANKEKFYQNQKLNQRVTEKKSLSYFDDEKPQINERLEVHDQRKSSHLGESKGNDDTQNNIRMELDYKNAIRAILKSNQRYPRRAVNRGIQGTVFLAFTVNKNGELEAHKIIETSGHRILDNAAVVMLLKSVPFPPFKDKIKGHRLHMSLPVNFNIK